MEIAHQIPVPSCPLPLADVRTRIEQVISIAHVSSPFISGKPDFSDGRELNRGDVYCLVRLVQKRLDSLHKACGDFLNSLSTAQGSDGLEWAQAMSLSTVMEASAWQAMDSDPNGPLDTDDLRSIRGAMSMLDELLRNVLRACDEATASSASAVTLQ